MASKVRASQAKPNSVNASSSCGLDIAAEEATTLGADVVEESMKSAIENFGSATARSTCLASARPGGGSGEYEFEFAAMEDGDYLSGEGPRVSS